MLRGVTIDLPPGSKAALVGPSGGGKVHTVALSQCSQCLLARAHHLHAQHLRVLPVRMQLY